MSKDEIKSAVKEFLEDSKLLEAVKITDELVLTMIKIMNCHRLRSGDKWLTQMQVDDAETFFKTMRGPCYKYSSRTVEEFFKSHEYNLFFTKFLELQKVENIKDLKE